MVNSKIISIFAIIALSLSCEKNNAKVTNRVELNPFSKIEINSNFDVYLVEDTTYFVEIKGFKKRLDKVRFSVEAGILKIDNVEKHRFTRPKTNKISLYIHALPLAKVSANETCFIRTINPITSNDFGLIFKSKANFADLELAGNTFYYWNNFPCGGKLTLRGTTNELKIWNTAILSVDAKNLITNYALVENSSKGLCEVNVVDKLDFSILNSGNIDVYGKPTILNEIATTGTGKLILY